MNASPIHYTLDLPLELLDRIKTAAKAEERTADGWMRRVIIEALDAETGPATVPTEIERQTTTVVWPRARPWIQEGRPGCLPAVIDDGPEAYYACACLAGHWLALAVEARRRGDIWT